MHRISRFLLTILFALLLAGCADQRILEDLGFNHTTAYDLIEQDDEKNKLLVTSMIPKVSSKSDQIKDIIYSTVARSSKEGRNKLTKQSEWPLVSGQLRSVLLGTSLARKGCFEYIDTLVRDPTISPRVKVSVVEGNAHDLLVKEFPPHSTTGRYLDMLLESEARIKTIPFISLHQFIRDYYDDGIDPVAPILKDQGNHVGIEGIALFNEDKYVAKVASEKSLIFAMLRGNLKNGELIINLDGTGNHNGNVMYSSLVSKRKIKVSHEKENNQYIVNIQLKAKGSILEYVGDLDLSDSNDRHELEKLLAENVTDQAKKIITTLQENNADSLGLGKYVRNSLSYSQWKSLDWDQIYAKMKVNCAVEIIIKDFGKFD